MFASCTCSQYLTKLHPMGFYSLCDSILRRITHPLNRIPIWTNEIQTTRKEEQYTTQDNRDTSELNPKH